MHPTAYRADVKANYDDDERLIIRLWKVLYIVMHKLRRHCASGAFSTPAEASNSSRETLIANDTHPSAHGVSLPWRPRPDRVGDQFAPLRSSRALVRRSRERPRGLMIVELWKNQFQLIDELLWSTQIDGKWNLVWRVSASLPNLINFNRWVHRFNYVREMF